MWGFKSKEKTTVQDVFDQRKVAERMHDFIDKDMTKARCIVLVWVDFKGDIHFSIGGDPGTQCNVQGMLFETMMVLHKEGLPND